MSYEELTGQHRFNCEHAGYPAFLNYTGDTRDMEGDIPEFTFLDPTLPDMDTKVFAARSWHRIIHSEVNPMYLRPYLGFRPLQVIKKTLERTTQMARINIRTPLRRHVKPRMPHMNVKRLDEVVSTDPLFSNVKSIYHGYIGAQVYYGVKSHTIFLYGFRSKNEFPQNYREFIRDRGAPSALRRDNAKEEQGEQVAAINREFLVKDQFTEPYHPQQNPVEGNAIRYLKDQVYRILDRTGAPEALWYYAAQYAADVHNICSDSTLPDEMTPMQYMTGITPDISAFLQYTFWQPVLYLDHEQTWPATKERSGRWIGVAHNIGDALTFWIMDDQSKQVLARSVVRPFKDNVRVKWDPDFLTSPIRHTAQNGGI
jgi:hypothetical protein